MINEPPKATKKTRTFTIHNETISDDYYWLREKGNPEVIKYLEEENRYTSEVLKPTVQLQEDLFLEMKNKMKESDVTAPEQKGNYLYYLKTIKGKQYKEYYRKKITDETEELLLDENMLAEGKEFYKLAFFKISPNQKYVAYATDTTGAELYSIYIKNLEDHVVTYIGVDRATYFCEWGNDSNTLYYAIQNKIKQPFQIFRYKISQNEHSKILYEEKDEQFYLQMYKSSDEQFIFLDTASVTSSEIHYINTDDNDGKFTIFQGRTKDLEFQVDHGTDIFYIRTNKDSSTNFKLMKTTIEATTKENWTEIIPHRTDVMLSAFTVFKDYIVLIEREDGLKKIRVVRKGLDQEDHYIKLPEPIYTIWEPEHLELSLIDAEYLSNTLRFFYSSLISPNTVYDYNMDKKELEAIKQYEVVGNFDSSNYTTERITAIAPDDTPVYISMVYKKNIQKDGKNPLLLYGYGSYGYGIEPAFQSYRFSLIDRGFIFAIAHIRGGGEMGRKWYDDGKLFSNNFLL